MNSPPVIKQKYLLNLLFVTLGLLLSGALLALGELCAYLLFVSPPPFPALIEAARVFYRDQDRNLAHFMPACSHYNPRTTYRLKPGACRFSTREFDTTISANSQGFRSPESDLQSPEVIVLGDSQSFGWGVNDEETYAAVLAQTLGVKVLNGSMPSYATVRELRVLEEVDLSRTKVLVLQYCENDRHENAVFAKNDGVLEIASKKVYAQHVAEAAARQARGYYPGKYLRLYLPHLFRTVRGYRPMPQNQKKARAAAWQDAGLFLRALQGSETPLTGIEIVVLHLSSYNDYKLPFIPALQRRWTAMQEQGRAPDLKLHFVRADQVLDNNDFYHLDDHLRASGHRKIAKLLADTIRPKL